MDTNKMLVLGRSQAVLNEMLAIIKELEFDAVATMSDKEATEYLKTEEFYYFLVGGGVLPPERGRLIALAKELKVKVLEPERGDRVTKEVLQTLLFKAT